MQLRHWEQKLFQARCWLQYWLSAVNEHSLHAPFAYQLYRQVIKEGKGTVPSIEKLRQQLLRSDRQLHIQELGAGSSISDAPIRKLSSIARHSLTPARFSQLLFRLVQFTGAQTILELGTSLGVNTLYLATAAPNGTIHTLEGCPHTAEAAKQHFAELAATNIHLHQGNIDEVLPALLASSLPAIDLAYLDANHTKEATLRYFSWLLPHLHEQSVVVVDDIHWSEGMQEAWGELCAHPSVSLSLDLYEAGILYFRSELQRQHYTIEY